MVSVCNFRESGGRPWMDFHSTISHVFESHSKPFAAPLGGLFSHYVFGPNHMSSLWPNPVEYYGRLLWTICTFLSLKSLSLFAPNSGFNIRRFQAIRHIALLIVLCIPFVPRPRISPTGPKSGNPQLILYVPVPSPGGWLRIDCRLKRWLGALLPNRASTEVHKPRKSCGTYSSNLVAIPEFPSLIQGR
jgi:hypothetical protein